MSKEKVRNSLREKLQKVIAQGLSVLSITKPGDESPAGSEGDEGSGSGFRNVRSKKPVTVVTLKSTGVPPTPKPSPKAERQGKRDKHRKQKHRQQARPKVSAATEAQNRTVEVTQDGRTITRTTAPAEPHKSIRPPKPVIAPAAAPVAYHAHFSSAPALHPLLENLGGEHYTRMSPRSDGSSLQAPGYVGKVSAKAVREMVLALDFGTSTTKVVIRDPVAESKGLSFAVPFFDTPGEPRYLQPSHIGLLGDRYTLSVDNMQAVSRNLKLSLLADNPEEHQFADAIGFLALVIRHARGWLYDQRAAEMRNATLRWRVVLGLPAADFGSEAIRSRYLRLGCAAAALAAGGDAVTSESALGAWRGATAHPVESRMEVAEQVVELIPEIVAQISGYVRSNFFDKAADPLMMVIDVGAGTLDAAVFNLVLAKGKQHIYAFGCSVEARGAAVLHRHRIAKLLGAIAPEGAFNKEGSRLLESSREPTDLPKLPEKAELYLNHMTLTPDPGEMDEDFYNGFGRQLFERTIQPAKSRNPGNESWRSLPVFLCGGGSRMPLYRDYARKTFNRGSTSIRMDVKQLPLPGDFRAKEIDLSNYHRLSVAYGLSVHQLGTYLRPDEIDKIGHTHGHGARQVADNGDNQN